MFNNTRAVCLCLSDIVKYCFANIPFVTLHNADRFLYPSLSNFTQYVSFFNAFVHINTTHISTVWHRSLSGTCLEFHMVTIVLTYGKEVRGVCMILSAWTLSKPLPQQAKTLKT